MKSKWRSKLHKLRASITLDWVVAWLCFMFAVWLMTHTFQWRDDQMILASKVWSDFGAHIPLIRSFSMGSNLQPVEYPTFPGEPIRYHYLFYLLVGGLEKWGLPINWALNLPSALGFGGMLLIIYKYGRWLFKSGLAGIMAVILTLFNGTLGFYYFFQKNPIGFNSFKDILTAKHFASFGPWDGQLVSAFWNLNIFTNQRHFGLSLALVLFSIYRLHRYLEEKKQPLVSLWPLVPSLVILPFLHQAGFVMLLICGVGLLLVKPLPIKRSLKAGAILLLAAVPGLLKAFWWSNNGAVSFEPGFLANPKTLIDWLRYWLFNLGVYLPLLPVMLISLKAPVKRLILAAMPLFIVANLFQLSPDMINNHKLINLFLIMMAIAAGGLLVKLWRQRFIAPVAALLFTGLTFSGVIDFFPIVNDSYYYINDIERDQTAKWIFEETPGEAVFLTTTYLYNPASLAGRKTFLDYGYFNWSMGYNDGQRRQWLTQLFSSQPREQVCRVLRENKIDYIYFGRGQGELGTVKPYESTIYRSFSASYSSLEGEAIFSVQENCDRG